MWVWNGGVEWGGVFHGGFNSNYKNNTTQHNTTQFALVDGTPKQHSFKLNVICRVNKIEREKRDNKRDEIMRLEMERLQEKIDAGLETKDERNLRKKMEKEQRRKQVSEWTFIIC